uniref:SFR19-like C-terminal domain-containing protein n=1 Tax=Cyanoderma ruficeps TaxID=181631 RepID=A0A8C3QGS8_9PASS
FFFLKNGKCSQKKSAKNPGKKPPKCTIKSICHSRSGEINPVKVNNLVCAYVQRYKYFRKRGRKGAPPEDPPGPPNPPGPPKDLGDKPLPSLPLPPL